MSSERIGLRNRGSIEPADLLDEDGKVDVSKVNSRTWTNAMRSSGKITPEMCAKIRRNVVGERRAGDVNHSIETEIPVSESTIREHANGSCSHDDHAPPARYSERVKGWVSTEAEGDGVDSDE